MYFLIPMVGALLNAVETFSMRFTNYLDTIIIGPLLFPFLYVPFFVIYFSRQADYFILTEYCAKQFSAFELIQIKIYSFAYVQHQCGNR